MYCFYLLIMQTREIRNFISHAVSFSSTMKNEAIKTNAIIQKKIETGNELEYKVIGACSD